MSYKSLLPKNAVFCYQLYDKMLLVVVLLASIGTECPKIYRKYVLHLLKYTT